MRSSTLLLASLLVAGALLLLQPGVVRAAGSQADYCAPGQTPSFVLGFAELKQLVGEAMGQALDCEHVNPANGDALQRTSTGLAFYRRATNTPTFTDGWRHWALTPAGLLRWTGASVDPPAELLAEALAALAAAPVPINPTCLPVGGRQCLRIEAPLVETALLLQATSTGPELLRVTAESRVLVRVGETPPESWAYFSPAAREVVLSPRLARYAVQERSAVLAHELRHVADLVQQGAALGTLEGCLATEGNAFRTQAAVWLEVWHGRPPRPENELQLQMYAIVETLRREPELFYEQLARIYQHECGQA